MKEVKDYPTPENCQHANEHELPLAQAVDYLQAIRASIPQDERDSAVLRGWSGVAIYHEHALTAAEEFAEKIELVRMVLRNYGQAGLSREMVEQLQKTLGP